MQPASGDAAEYRFLTAREPVSNAVSWRNKAGENCKYSVTERGSSLANILLWFVANAWRREFLSFGELGFVHLDGRLAVGLRIADEAPADSHGILHLRDRGESMEWAITEEGLKQVALWMHGLVSKPGHEYDRLLVAEGSECGMHLRMTDAADWLQRGIA